VAVAGSAPLTGWLLQKYGWQQMIIIEGLLPFVWLPIWWFGIRDHPRQAKWISTQERSFLETTLEKERLELETPKTQSFMVRFREPAVLVMILLYFLHNCAAYGCMNFFTNGLRGQGFSGVQY